MTDAARATATSAPGTRAPQGTPRALVFRLGGRELAALPSPGSRIVEIDSWTRIPTAPPYVLGLANVHGKILSVIDVRAELGLPQPPWSLPVEALVVGDDALRAACALEEVVGFEIYEGSHPESHRQVGRPAEHPRQMSLGGYGMETLALADRQVVRIDLPAIVDSLRLRKADERAGTQP